MFNFMFNFQFEYDVLCKQIVQNIHTVVPILVYENANLQYEFKNSIVNSDKLMNTFIMNL